LEVIMLSPEFDQDLGISGDARRCPTHPHVKTSSGDMRESGAVLPAEVEADVCGIQLRHPTEGDKLIPHRRRF
jgi:hypothetical protein